MITDVYNIFATSLHECQQNSLKIKDKYIYKSGTLNIEITQKFAGELEDGSPRPPSLQSTPFFNSETLSTHVCVAAYSHKLFDEALYLNILPDSALRLTLCRNQNPTSL